MPSSLIEALPSWLPEWLKWWFSLPWWSIVLTLLFASLAVLSSLAGNIKQQQAAAAVSSTAAKRNELADRNRSVFEHVVVGQSRHDLDGTVWVALPAELKRLQRLDFQYWPDLAKQHASLLHRLSALSASDSPPNPALSTKLPADLYEDLIFFRKEVLAAK